MHKENHRNLKHVRFPTITSTQTYCVDNMQSIVKYVDDENMYCVSSEIQVSGKGKYGSVWESPKGNMYASYVMQMSEKVDNVELVQRTAVASSVSLESFGVDNQIKWINDLLLNNKKIGGIICDSIEMDQKNYLIIGIGINLENSPPTNLSTSVLEETEIQINPTALIVKISEAIHKYIKCTSYDEIIIEYGKRLDAYKRPLS